MEIRSKSGRLLVIGPLPRWFGFVVSMSGILATSLSTSGLSTASAKTLEVGPGKPYSRIEQANNKASPGDVILVHPLPDNRAYTRTALFVRQNNLTFRAAPAKDSRWVKISGEGFDYSGQGNVPRAIIQFNRGSDNCTLEGFELVDAHNLGHNGSGVRINQANEITIRNCNIHHNDMGIMSNGDGTQRTAINQQIQDCLIHHNGNTDDPGYNHNLYLGGTSVTLIGCEVHSSLTGHNVKSRAHHTSVLYCYIHHSASREFDLVDGADTKPPNSHAVLMGNIIAKDPNCTGNRAVLHFGQDGGHAHNGTVHLIFNTVVTPFISPVISLSSPLAKARLLGNLICDGGIKQNNQRIVIVRKGAEMRNVTGKFNWFSGDFKGLAETKLDPSTNLLRRVVKPMFAGAHQHNYRLTDSISQTMITRISTKQIEFPPTPGVQSQNRQGPLARQYHHPAGTEERPAQERVTLGAYGR